MVSRSVAQSKAWSIVRVLTHIGVSLSSPPKRDRILNATHNYPFSSSSELSITTLSTLCRAEIWNCYHPFKHTTCYGSNHRHSHRRRITGSVLISRINNNNSTVHHPLNLPHHHLYRSMMNSSLPIIWYHRCISWYSSSSKSKSEFVGRRRINREEYGVVWCVSPYFSGNSDHNNNNNNNTQQQWNMMKSVYLPTSSSSTVPIFFFDYHSFYCYYY